MDTLGAVTAVAADRDGPSGLVPAGTKDAIECKSPGCSNWFVKRSGRHVYCKAPNCTYRRGVRLPPEMAPPVGAAAELLLRLQDPEGGGDVGPDVIGVRLREVSRADRAGDEDALYGSLIDSAAGLTRWAERVRTGTMPKRSGGAKSAMAPPSPPGRQPVGLVHAALASHARTVVLAERRLEAWQAMIAAREAVAVAEDGARATIGTESSVAADGVLLDCRAGLERADRQLQALEAAWAERLQAVRELWRAGESVGAPALRGANGRAAA